MVFYIYYGLFFGKDGFGSIWIMEVCIILWFLGLYMLCREGIRGEKVEGRRSGKGREEGREREREKGRREREREEYGVGVEE